MAKLILKFNKVEKGGKGSGNFGHKGRAGEVGGSSSGGGSTKVIEGLYMSEMHTALAKVSGFADKLRGTTQDNNVNSSEPYSGEIPTVGKKPNSYLVRTRYSQTAKVRNGLKRLGFTEKSKGRDVTGGKLYSFMKDGSGIGVIMRDFSANNNNPMKSAIFYVYETNN